MPVSQTRYDLLRTRLDRLTRMLPGVEARDVKAVHRTRVASRRLRELNPEIVLASVQPDSPLHGLEGLKHMQSAIVPGIYDPDLADFDLRATTEEAYQITRRLAREEGLLVGISSGANLAGALKLVRGEDAARERAAVVVIVFPDGGDRYLSERFWEES